MKLRGEVCVGTGSFLSALGVLLLIFAHVGQLNSSTIPRSIAIVTVDVSGYGKALQAATGDPTPNLYNTSQASPMGEGFGLRQSYEWGLYSVCGYVSPVRGNCSKSEFGNRFTPFDVILHDTPDLYLVQTVFLLPANSTFVSSTYLSSFSNGAGYLIMLGTVAAMIAFVFGLYRSITSFTIACTMITLSVVTLFTGAVIWTAILNKTRSINKVNVLPGVPLGIIVSYGNGLWLIWAGFVLILLSAAPYGISCWTFRRSRRY